MTNGTATAEGMPEQSHLRNIVSLDRDHISPDSLLESTERAIKQLEHHAEDIGVALDWETVAMAVKVHPGGYAFLRIEADVL